MKTNQENPHANNLLEIACTFGSSIRDRYMKVRGICKDIFSVGDLTYCQVPVDPEFAKKRFQDQSLYKAQLPDGVAFVVEHHRTNSALLGTFSIVASGEMRGNGGETFEFTPIEAKRVLRAIHARSNKKDIVKDNELAREYAIRNSFKPNE